MIEDLREVRRTAADVAQLSTSQKRAVLRGLAKALEQKTTEILAANEVDVTRAQAEGLEAASLDRLKLSPSKIKLMAEQVLAVARQNDPVGQVDHAIEMAPGLKVLRRRVPMGVIAMIFESRPDAVTQIFSLCLFSGNAIVLKGGREASASVRCLVDTIRQVLIDHGLPPTAVLALKDRAEVSELLQTEGLVDLVIPRGGRDLVLAVQSQTKIPVLGHADGVCHLYIDTDADWDTALALAVDGKTQAPATCNAIETILIHEDVLEPMAIMLPEAMPGVSLRCQKEVLSALPDDLAKALANNGSPEWDKEFGTLELNLGVVRDLDRAIDHINRHSSHHTDVIVTENPDAARKFQALVDSASVGWNASSRFADGFRFGLGAEVGISTSKIHARGPVGLEGLLTWKFEFQGEGHQVSDYVGESARKFTHRQLRF